MTPGNFPPENECENECLRVDNDASSSRVIIEHVKARDFSVSI